jgi:hypothetical protein
MKTQFKNPINNFVPVFLMVAAMFILGFGCKTPDPLAGFHPASKNPDQIIEKDYQDYIHKFSPEERKYTGPISFFEDGTGQHAVVIEVDLNGTAWNHVLFYDKDNKRIKVIKYVGWHYMS